MSVISSEGTFDFKKLNVILIEIHVLAQQEQEILFVFYGK